jgi:ribosomal-protein-alanine N-acetyltransferase
VTDQLVVEEVASDADLDAVVDLEARCFTNPWTREMLVRELVRGDVAHLFVLRLPDRTVAAFCFCWIIVDELHVNTIAVDAAHRRRGLGRRLMREVLRRAAQRGATRATLEVRASNVPARRMYEALGFTVRGVRNSYYSQPEEDALVLWKEGLADLDRPEV